MCVKGKMKCNYVYLFIIEWRIVSYWIYYKGSVLFFIGEVIDLFFDLINKYFVCSGDKYVFVFNNIIGYRVFIDDF